VVDLARVADVSSQPALALQFHRCLFSLAATLKPALQLLLLLGFVFFSGSIKASLLFWGNPIRLLHLIKITSFRHGHTAPRRLQCFATSKRAFALSSDLVCIPRYAECYAKATSVWHCMWQDNKCNHWIDCSRRFPAAH